jgi:hypothetical protein
MPDISVVITPTALTRRGYVYRTVWRDTGEVIVDQALYGIDATTAALEAQGHAGSRVEFYRPGRSSPDFIVHALGARRPVPAAFGLPHAA